METSFVGSLSQRDERFGADGSTGTAQPLPAAPAPSAASVPVRPHGNEAPRTSASAERGSAAPVAVALKCEH